MDYYRSPQTLTPGLLVKDTGLLILRWTAGLTLIYFHAWDETMAGWKHVWQKAPWAYAAEISDRGFPLPEAVAIASTAAAMLGSALLLSGLLSRVSALALLICSVVAIFLYGRIPEFGERLALYAGIYLVLVVCGPGRFSLDAVLNNRRAER